MQPAENTTLQLKQRQEQKLSPKQLQSIAVLQMTTADLAEYIQQIATENPLLECELSERREPEMFSRSPRASYADTSISAAELVGKMDPAINGLPLLLAEQLSRRHLPPALLRCCAYLITLLDDRGYLPPDEIADAAERFDGETLRAAITELQSLEPAGIAARDLSECLCLQLSRHSPQETLALKIAAEYLPQLGQRRYRQIARALQTTESAVADAARLIAALEPNPCGDCIPETDVPYIQPDVVILSVEGKLTAVLAEWLLPRLSVSSSYQTLLKQAEDPETVAYLQRKLQQVKWLISNVARRGQTLQLCADTILSLNEAFFAGQTRELRPLTAAQLARHLGLHPSTISRTLQGKYLQCRAGVFPLRYFCSGQAGDNASSRQAVGLRIAALISKEDPAHPLSDSAIQSALEKDGVTISRRAVTKYRSQLHIPSTSVRRRAR